MKRKTWLVITVTLSAIIFASLFCILTFAAEATDDVPTPKNDSIIADPISGEIGTTDATVDTVKISPSKTAFANNEDVVFILDGENVSSYTYSVDGISVKNSANSRFVVAANDGFGKLELNVTLTNGDVKQEKLFTYKDRSITAVSTTGYDTAWNTYMKLLYDAGKITMDEWQEAYGLLTVDYSVENPSVDASDDTASSNDYATDGVTVVRGNLQYEINDEGDALPLRQIKVTLFDKDFIISRSFATTYTDNNGNFVFTIPDSDWEALEDSGADVFIRFYAWSYTFGVKDAILTNVYYIQTPTIENVVAGSADVVINRIVEYDEDSDTCKGMYVSQGAVAAQRFAVDMGVDFEDSFISIVYPSSITEWKATDTNPNPDFMVDNLGLFLSTVTFTNYNTIMHEYFHFVQQVLQLQDFDILEGLLNSWAHNTNEDNLIMHTSKNFATKLTWSESWVETSVYIAQLKYADDYNGFVGLNDNAQLNATASPAIANQSVPHQGEGVELYVQNFLFDLFDSGATHPLDTISMGYQDWWDLTAYPGVYTLSDFMVRANQYYEQNKTKYPDFPQQVANLLSLNTISPSLSLVNAGQINYNTPPTIEWTAEGSTVQYNNRFEVVFMDSEYNVLYTSPSIDFTATSMIKNYSSTFVPSHNTTFTYTIPSYWWQQIVNSYGGTFITYVTVRAYSNHKFPETGPYSSNYQSIITQTQASNISFTSLNRYTEEAVKLEPGGIHRINLTFPVNTTVIVQTTGHSRTKVELWRGSVKVAGDNSLGAGYGLNSMLAYNGILAGVTYNLYVYNLSEELETIKTTITRADGAFNSSTVNLNEITFEDFRTGILSNYNANVTLNSYHGKIIAYTASTTANYRITLSSGYDTYVYIVDTLSADYSGTAEADDGNGRDSEITLQLIGGRTYFLVITTYYMEAQSAPISVSVNIARQD